MTPSTPPGAGLPAPLVPAGQDRFGEVRGLGISRIDFKVVPAGGPDVLVLENVFQALGGPGRHLHHHQDEWFYALEGEFVIKVGEERSHLHPGDSLLAPRGVPHVWAHVGPCPGRILVAFFPAGQMEAFFEIVNRQGAMPPLDPELWRAHGMELLGPPLLADR